MQDSCDYRKKYSSFSTCRVRKKKSIPYLDSMNSNTLFVTLHYDFFKMLALGETGSMMILYYFLQLHVYLHISQNKTLI
jgi:hypothetical protein